MSEQQATNLRESRGLEIAHAKGNQISRLDSMTYEVLSQSQNAEYAVCLSEDEWRCECPDYRFRGVERAMCARCSVTILFLEIRA